MWIYCHEYLQWFSLNDAVYWKAAEFKYVKGTDPFHMFNFSITTELTSVKLYTFWGKGDSSIVCTNRKKYFEHLKVFFRSTVLIQPNLTQISLG